VVGRIAAHDDIIWDLKFHPFKPLLVSVSADKTIKLWNVDDIKRSSETDFDSFFTPSVKVLNTEDSTSVPTSVSFVNSDLNKLIVSFSNSEIILYDIETGQPVIKSFENVSSTYNNTVETQINRIITHYTLPIAITAHEDRCIKFFDLNTSKSIHSMVAHLDAVSTLDISPNGLVLASAGHDSSIRLWDISNYACLQEFTSHRKKYDEAIHSVKFHPRMQGSLTGSKSESGVTSVFGGSSWLGSCGADGCCKLYGL
jgi:striatin 1/3/4